ncbi:MAG TPA: AbrB/MazE/SpoVT family DNA-binding domain-containing protein [Candidatus Hodarchaeales archaeon]|nr:AbrB/MazE/SpoVT family DNA-binding domain-containing protein [Candidatus Hodarchaeales archaeon]
MSNENIITKKGQITIPAFFREEFKLKPGTKVVFVKSPEGLLIKPATDALRNLRGIIKSSLSLESIERAVSEIRQALRIKEGTE